MKLACYAAIAAALIAGCSKQRPIIYKEVPPVTHQIGWVVDVSSPELPGSKQTARMVHLKKRIAIARFGDVGWIDDVPFKRDDEITAKAGGPEHVTEMLINELHNSGRFDIVERKNIEDVLKEMKFGETRYVEKTSAAKAGDVLGAQCVLMATAGRGDSGGVVVFLRMVDVSTSRITASVAGAGHDLLRAIVEATAQLIKASEETPWVGKVAQVEDGGKKSITVDAGKDLGLRPGDVFAVFSLGEPVTDAAGKLLGYREEGAGIIKIVEVKDRFSIAQPVEIVRDLKRGDLVRPAVLK